MRHEKLEEIKRIIPMVKNMSIDDCAISIWDREGTVLYFQKAESFPLRFDIGFKLTNKNDDLFKAMDTGKVVNNVTPAEVFGVPIKAKLVPVFDGGDVVGCIACAFSWKEFGDLKSKTDRMEHILSESKESIFNILNDVVNITDSLKEVQQFVGNLKNNLSGVYGVVDSIKGNTARTKMLALNASIEAARAGESGKGFKIVANEMGKLSQMSAESVTDINETLNEMVKSINDVTKSIEEINDVSSKNSGSVEKLLSGLNKITAK